MEAIKFEEEDIVGEDTLDVISSAGNFNTWMYQTIKPYCKGKVLEIGSGIGNISEYLMKDGFPIMLTDIRTGYCEKLISRFNDNSSFLGAKVMDLTDVDFEQKFADQLRSYDTVFALNVVEHIQNDSLAIKNCRKLLKENGHLIILVPSYKGLYNRFDKELGHYRRYTKSALAGIFKENKLDIIHKQYFNFIGIFGWYVSGKLLQNKSIPESQMKLYNMLIPISRIIDNIIFNLLGLSTIVVGKK
ncbi:MAG: methyltransferase type 12 [Bacteroidetes bacterium]|nr:MAG: methyltransferase type 12 [Bacteroidota bacterium]